MANNVLSTYCVPDVVIGLTFLWKFICLFFLKDWCALAVIANLLGGPGYSARFMGVTCAETRRHASSGHNPSVWLCLCKAWDGAGWLAYISPILSFPWGAVSCHTMLWYGKQDQSPQSRGCQAHSPQEVKSGGSDCVVRRDFAWWALGWTLIQRQLQAAIFGFDTLNATPVCQALSECDWHTDCWQYKVNPAGPLGMWPSASRQGSGWEWNVGFCSRGISA